MEARIAQIMGKPYKWMAAGPDFFDCMGVVYYLTDFRPVNLLGRYPKDRAEQVECGKLLLASGTVEECERSPVVFMATDGPEYDHFAVRWRGLLIHCPIGKKVEAIDPKGIQHISMIGIKPVGKEVNYLER